jgi:hypothetical protein
LFWIAEIHFEWNPDAALVQYSHVPGSVRGVGKLPEYLIAILVRETLAVSLQNSTALSPNAALQCVDSGPTALEIRAAQQLKCVDRFDTR